MKTTAGKGNDWALYRRLLTYVTQYTGVFVLSIIGFLAYSLANVLLADLTQFLSQLSKIRQLFSIDKEA